MIKDYFMDLGPRKKLTKDQLEEARKIFEFFEEMMRDPKFAQKMQEFFVPGKCKQEENKSGIKKHTDHTTIPEKP